MTATRIEHDGIGPVEVLAARPPHGGDWSGPGPEIIPIPV